MRFACQPDELGDGKMACAVDGDEQIYRAFGCFHLANTHMKEADGIALEALTLGLVAFEGAKREMPCRWTHRCSADRVRCEMVGCNAYRQSSRDSRICRRDASSIASSASLRVVE